MSMLARYKKSEKTFLELVKLLETSADDKRENLLKMVRAEDPSFAAKVEGRMLTYEDLYRLPDNFIAEIVSACAPKILGTILAFEENEEFRKTVEKSLAKKFAEVKSEREALEGVELSDSQKKSAQRKVVAEARKLEESGAFKLPTKVVDASGFSVGGDSSHANPDASAQARANASPGEKEVGGDGLAPEGASAAMACPPIESFGLDPAPPGLSGERFTTFVDNALKS